MRTPRQRRGSWASSSEQERPAGSEFESQTGEEGQYGLVPELGYHKGRGALPAGLKGTPRQREPGVTQSPRGGKLLDSGWRLERRDGELMFPAGWRPRLYEALLGWEGGQGPGQQNFHRKPWVGLTLRTREAGVCPGTRKRIIVGGAAGTVHPQGRRCCGPDSAWLEAPLEGPPPSPMHPREDGLDHEPQARCCLGRAPRRGQLSCLPDSPPQGWRLPHQGHPPRA